MIVFITLNPVLVLGYRTARSDRAASRKSCSSRATEWPVWLFASKQVSWDSSRAGHFWSQAPLAGPGLTAAVNDLPRPRVTSRIL